YPPVASFLFSLLLRSPRSSLFPTRRSSDLIAVHAVWLDDEEVALMGARDAALAYCPSSNMFLGDGVTRLPELLRAGVRAGLGTDGGCTNNRLSVFEEMRMASLLQRVRLLDGGALPA